MRKLFLAAMVVGAEEFLAQGPDAANVKFTHGAECVVAPRAPIGASLEVVALPH